MRASAAASATDVSFLVHVKTAITWWQANHGHLNAHRITAFVLRECHVAANSAVVTNDMGDGAQWFVL